MPHTPEESVRRLLQVISRQLSFSAAIELLDENLNSYMDGRLLSCNAQAWFRWVRFLQYSADKKILNLSIVIDNINNVNDIVTVTAHWSGVIDGKVAVSEPGTVAYQICNSKIVNIWTHKKNYIFIYGNSITKTPVFYWLLLRVLLWRQPPLEPSDQLE